MTTAQPNTAPDVLSDAERRAYWQRMADEVVRIGGGEEQLKRSAPHTFHVDEDGLTISGVGVSWRVIAVGASETGPRHISLIAEGGGLSNLRVLLILSTLIDHCTIPSPEWLDAGMEQPITLGGRPIKVIPTERGGTTATNTR